MQAVAAPRRVQFDSWQRDCGHRTAAAIQRAGGQILRVNSCGGPNNANTGAAGAAGAAGAGARPVLERGDGRVAAARVELIRYEQAV
eukprot:SAG22_NODE_2382_length_2632_cov_1.309514_2_plen_87_part_00